MTEFTIDEVLASLERARREQYAAATRADALEMLARKMLENRQETVSSDSVEFASCSVMLGSRWEGMMHALVQTPKNLVQFPTGYH